MKGISGNPALDAYQRVALSPVSKVKTAAPVEAVSSPGGPRAEAAQVTISAEARQLAQTRSGEAPVDTQRVEALKSKIAEGSMKVDSRLIADRMLSQIA